MSAAPALGYILTRQVFGHQHSLITEKTIGTNKARLLGESFFVCAIGNWLSPEDLSAIIENPDVWALSYSVGTDLWSYADIPRCECANSSLWIRGYRVYPAPRGSREGKSGTVYFGAAHWNIVGKKVSVLVQFLPGGVATRPHYHKTEELYVCFDGAFKMATSPLEGGVQVNDFRPGILFTVAPQTLHASIGISSTGTWNLVCCVRHRSKGDGVLRNHYWKDVTEDVYQAVVSAIEPDNGDQ